MKKIQLTPVVVKDNIIGMCEVDGRLFKPDAEHHAALARDLQDLFREMLQKCGVVEATLHVEVVGGEASSVPADRIHIVGFWKGRGGVQCAFPYELPPAFALRLRWVAGAIAWLHTEHFSEIGHRCILCDAALELVATPLVKVYTGDSPNTSRCPNVQCFSHELMEHVRGEQEEAR